MWSPLAMARHGVLRADAGQPRRRFDHLSVELVMTGGGATWPWCFDHLAGTFRTSWGASSVNRLLSNRTSANFAGFGISNVIQPSTLAPAAS